MKEIKERFTVGVIVANYPGVLNRVSGLYAKRSYNIDSLAVGETENPDYSRITIVSTGDESMKDQVLKQLLKLHDVKKAAILSAEASISVEHVLVKLKTNGSGNTKFSEIINAYGGRIMDFSNTSITVEITGSSERIDSFILEVKTESIMELCRSGAISMGLGAKNALDIKNLKVE